MSKTLKHVPVKNLIYRRWVTTRVGSSLPENMLGLWLVCHPEPLLSLLETLKHPPTSKRAGEESILKPPPQSMTQLSVKSSKVMLSRIVENLVIVVLPNYTYLS